MSATGKTHYVVMFASLNAAPRERVSVGLYMYAGSEVMFRYSKRKLRRLKQWLSPGAGRLVQMALEDVDPYVDLGLETDNKNSLFPARQVDLTAQFEYMAAYANNLITYTRPTPIDYPYNEESFDKLYASIVDSYAAQQKDSARLELRAVVKKRLLDRIKSHVSIEEKAYVTPQLFSGLPSRVRTDFAGQNGRLVVGQILDFAFHPDAAENRLIAAYALHHVAPDAKIFAISEEPPRENAQAHEKWNAARRLPYLTYVPAPELETITDYVKAHNVQPLPEPA